MTKKIIIVGGVAGGMSAATRLRRLDESAAITVFEQGGYTGFANCGIPYALGNVIKNDDALILRTPNDFKERFNIDVHLHTEVVGIDRENHLVNVRTVGTDDIRQVDYDKLILAQGAEAFRPPADGAELDHVVTMQTISDLQKVRALMSDRDVKHACIIGAGFIGVEVAENMRNLGLEVSMVEYGSHVFPPIDADMAEILHTELKRKGIKLFLNATSKKIEKSRVLLTCGSEVPADLVILAAGVRARTSLAKQAGLDLGRTGVNVNSHMQTSDPDIYAVGDMVETQHTIMGQPAMLALAGPANRQGRLAADHICGKEVQYRGNVGTAICQVFDLTVGFVGLSIKALRRLGHDPLWVTVHPPDHASYYPGSQAMTIKLAFQKETGRILGAQIVGKAGVDKRIDVLATAMQFGMTVFDLEHLELVYAPPYGSAKDPVNMAGFVASNVLRGDCEIIHAEQFNAEKLGELQIVDVRSPGEFARGHLSQAINLPVDSLRHHLSVLDTSLPVVVYCQVGYRGYLAYRILKQAGFDVTNLDGGFKMVAEGGFKLIEG
ncbi:FAD-dependent pyridine nucleotide-disulfide oxidoreductase [Ilyonectria robusta]|uniref:FAD-dependent pyridine nucleotide-disulfide oxidoreductase n=1 Tax=Ilyonectria robusta TaxID=1079257 RepID=UPI001E8D2961|nr:FAD-dependent pyridine nucleotide-disulfide oxidoreductase [Ilyonectria robusta]KAH8662715.1 FAD-dependent pyridine nucleotide-disulfide oxidoreductase [Ilyonectria robusta]